MRHRPAVPKKLAKNVNSPSLVFVSSGQDELEGVMRDIRKELWPLFPGQGGQRGPFKSEHIYGYLEKIDLIVLETYMLTRLAFLWAICLWSHSGGKCMLTPAFVLKDVCAVRKYLHTGKRVSFRLDWFIPGWVVRSSALAVHFNSVPITVTRWLTAYYCRWISDWVKYIALEILQPRIDAGTLSEFSQLNPCSLWTSNFHINFRNVFHTYMLPMTKSLIQTCLHICSCVHKHKWWNDTHFVVI